MQLIFFYLFIKKKKKRTQFKENNMHSTIKDALIMYMYLNLQQGYDVIAKLKIINNCKIHLFPFHSALVTQKRTLKPSEI